MPRTRTTPAWPVTSMWLTPCSAPVQLAPRSHHVASRDARWIRPGLGSAPSTATAGDGACHSKNVLTGRSRECDTLQGVVVDVLAGRNRVLVLRGESRNRRVGPSRRPERKGSGVQGHPVHRRRVRNAVLVRCVAASGADAQQPRPIAGRASGLPDFWNPGFHAIPARGALIGCVPRHGSCAAAPRDFQAAFAGAATLPVLAKASRSGLIHVGVRRAHAVREAPG